MGEESLFQTAARRMSCPRFAAPLVVTGNDFRFIVIEQLAAAEIAPQAVAIEPEGRNTAPAILAAALLLEREEPGALLLVTPSDHVIPDDAAFRAAVFAACSQAQAGGLVTFGIPPTRAETEYGWLELAPGADAAATTPQQLVRFVEKPQAAQAQAMLASGHFLWNAGIFLFSAKALIIAFRTHAPDVLEPVEAAVANAKRDLGFIRLDAAAWGRVPNISLDYAIMERAENLTVIPYAAGWSDIAGWEAVWREGVPDADGNVTFGLATNLDCRNTLLRSESPRLALVGIGLQDMVAVAMPDAVLVAPRSQAHRVKDAVADLKARNVAQATEFPTDHRPWGWFESLAQGERFQVKRIVVKPGAALSLQSHQHRSEHWIVVEGTARVTVEDTVRLLAENQSVYIPIGVRHRLENPGTLPVILIEVQTGSYLGEDDIIRHDDAYNRGHESPKTSA
jgi:mannose-1-phosphate guanylyltransferase/mannose-6-phosphate isomerase